LIQASIPKQHLVDLVVPQGFSFPLAVKPDVGRMGFMFRRIHSLTELVQYHENIKVDYLLQEFIHYPLEVSVFYYRFPNEKRGTITGFVSKEHLAVTGNGVSTLHELMMNYPRVQFRLDEMKAKHAANLQRVVPYDQQYVLCQALNLSRGGKLVSLEHEKDERLLTVIDTISQAGNFYFGRYDIKCESIESLKNGNFSILEFNGSGAEPHHVYGNGNSLIRAIKILLHHWKILYKISVANHQRGVSYWSFAQGLRHMITVRKHIKLLRKLEFSSSHSRRQSGPQTEKNKADILQPYGLTVNKSVRT
jgi:hypothetical protein